MAFEVSVNNFESKIIDGADGPTLSVGFNINWSIADLLDSLQKWQKDVQQKSVPAAPIRETFGALLPLDGRVV